MDYFLRKSGLADPPNISNEILQSVSMAIN
jgi:hypothetical protein